MTTAEKRKSLEIIDIPGDTRDLIIVNPKEFLGIIISNPEKQGDKILAYGKILQQYIINTQDDNYSIDEDFRVIPLTDAETKKLYAEYDISYYPLGIKKYTEEDEKTPINLPTLPAIIQKSSGISEDIPSSEIPESKDTKIIIEVAEHPYINFLDFVSAPEDIKGYILRRPAMGEKTEIVHGKIPKDFENFANKLTNEELLQLVAPLTEDEAEHIKHIHNIDYVPLTIKALIQEYRNSSTTKNIESVRDLKNVMVEPIPPIIIQYEKELSSRNHRND